MKVKEVTVEDIARRLLQQYLQSWGQSREDRIAPLNAAVAFVGIDATFVQREDQAGWVAEEMAEAKKAQQFRKEIDRCFPLGQVEWEQTCIEGVIEKWQGNGDDNE